MLLDSDGATLGEHEADTGFLAVAEGGFPAALRQTLACPQAPSIPVPIVKNAHSANGVPSPFS